ncbi:hypothetical protein T06_11292 [Trichinella sp. T6]|nr:hypothetical protein T06_11292 [Trichinella sp. T6]
MEMRWNKPTSMRAFDSLKVALEHYLKRNSDHCAKLINLEVIWKPTVEQATEASSASLKCGTLQAKAYSLLQKAETLLSTSENHRFGSEVLTPDDSGSEYLNGGSSKFSGMHFIENCITSVYVKETSTHSLKNLK